MTRENDEGKKLWRPVDPMRHHREREWDYRGRAIYHFTLPVEGRYPLFGSLEGESAETAVVRLNPFGRRVCQMLGGLAQFYKEKGYALKANTVVSANLQWLGYSGSTIKVQVIVAALGFATFGVGYELCGITVSKVIVKWFSGKEMALAMGIQVALARLGTALALAGAPPLAEKFSLSTPILIGLFSVGLGLIIYLLYCSIDRKADTALEHTVSEDDEKFHFSDMGATIKNPGRMRRSVPA